MGIVQVLPDNKYIPSYHNDIDIEYEDIDYDNQSNYSWYSSNIDIVDNKTPEEILYSLLTGKSINKE